MTREELLVECFVATYRWRGVALDDESERLFDLDVDTLYRACLAARRSPPPQSLRSRLTEIRATRGSAQRSAREAAARIADADGTLSQAQRDELIRRAMSASVA